MAESIKRTWATRALNTVEVAKLLNWVHAETPKDMNQFDDAITVEVRDGELVCWYVEENPCP